MTATEPTNRIPFVAVLCIEGVPTGDGRYLEPGTGSWRDLPQDIYSKDIISPGHDGAEFAGQLTSIRMDGRRMIGEGWFDGDTEVGAETARRVGNATTRFVSIDMADAEVTVEPIYDDAGEIVGTLARFGPYKIMGATVTSHPAFEQAVIWLQDQPAPAESFAELPEPLGPPAPMPDEEEIYLYAAGAPTLALVAAGTIRPPRAWFEMPEPDELTPMEITDEGQVYGHIAPWDCCHIGFLNKCVEPPRGCDYDRNYHLGQVVTAEGDRIAVGGLTIGGGHPDESLSAEAARARYDDASIVGANVRVVDGKYGPWACGSVRPGTTDEQIAKMRQSSGPSGDWRPIGGRLELVNVHYVNTPGFPVPRLRARVASGELVSLTASVGEVETIAEGIEAATPDVVDAVQEIVEEAAGAGAEDGGESSPAAYGPAPTALDKVLEPILEAQRDEILERHPAPPDPSPLATYLASREDA